jgi:hypothetical protein
MDFADLQGRANRGERTVRVCLDRSLNDEHDQLNAELIGEQHRSAHTLADGSRSRDLAERILELEDRMAEARVPIKITSLSNREFRKLIAKHPARDKNAEDELRGFNTETFPPAIVAACSVDPKMTPEQADELLFDLLTNGDAEALVDAVLRDSVIASAVPFSAIASAVIRDTEKSSEQLASGE